MVGRELTLSQRGGPDLVRRGIEDEGGRDLFVHFTGITGDGYRSLAEGAKVAYEEEQGDKGPKAINVQKL